MKKERDVFDIIKEAQEEIGKDKPLSELNKEDPITEGNEILFGKDGKCISHHRCNICDHLFNNSELLEDKDIGLICEDCNDNKDELEREQEDVATLFRHERNNKAGI